MSLVPRSIRHKPIKKSQPLTLLSSTSSSSTKTQNTLLKKSVSSPWFIQDGSSLDEIVPLGSKVDQQLCKDIQKHFKANRHKLEDQFSHESNPQNSRDAEKFVNTYKSHLNLAKFDQSKTE